MKKPLFSFGLVADCQYADRDNATAISSDRRHYHDNRYRSSLDKLKEAIDLFNTKELEFVVHLGDFVDQKIEVSAPPLLRVAAQSNTPLWHVLGNHEYHLADCDESTILAMYDMQNPYYSRTVGSYRFIVLDTNEIGVIKHRERTSEWEEANRYLQSMKDSGALNAYPWNGGIGLKQQEWLRAQMEDATQSGQRVILFAHHPIFPYEGANALNDHEILNIIDQTPSVIAYINGHNHFGSVGMRKGIPYVTMPAVVEAESNAYSVVSVYEDSLQFVSYGRAQDLLFEIS